MFTTGNTHLKYRKHPVHSAAHKLKIRSSRLVLTTAGTDLDSTDRAAIGGAKNSSASELLKHPILSLWNSRGVCVFVSVYVCVGGGSGEETHCSKGNSHTHFYAKHLAVYLTDPRGSICAKTAAGNACVLVSGGGGGSADGGAKVVAYSWGGMKTANEQCSCLEGCSFLLLLKRCIMQLCLLKTFVSFH